MRSAENLIKNHISQYISIALYYFNMQVSIFRHSKIIYISMHSQYTLKSLQTDFRKLEKSRRRELTCSFLCTRRCCLQESGGTKLEQHPRVKRQVLTVDAGRLSTTIHSHRHKFHNQYRSHSLRAPCAMAEFPPPINTIYVTRDLFRIQFRHQK